MLTTVDYEVPMLPQPCGRAQLVLLQDNDGVNKMTNSAARLCAMSPVLIEWMWISFTL